MTGTLGIITCDLGSAPCIDLHIRDLAPGRTVAIGSDGPGALALWPVPCPVFRVDQWKQRLPFRLARRAGLSAAGLQEAAVTRFLRRHDVQVVFGQYFDYFVEFVPLLDRLRIPYVVQGHGIDVSAALRKPGMAERFLRYRSARAILTRSEFHRQRLIALGLPAAKVHVNFGGIQMATERPRRPLSAGKRFLAIGRMVSKKGPIYLLESFRRAAERDSEITLDYIGGGELFPAAREFVNATGLAGRVRLHGVVPDETKYRLLRECGVLVQHSITDPDSGDEEGLPGAIQEGMAYAMAVVSTRHAGIPEAVADGETGLLVAEGDVAGMADAFVRVPALATQLGDAGYHRALVEHVWPCERDRLRHWLFSAS